MNTLDNKYAIQLPEMLTSKSVIVSTSGTVAELVKTSARTHVGEIIYALRYIYKFTNGKVFKARTDQPYIETDRRGSPVQVGTGWTRDQLFEMGCLYIPRKDVTASNIIEAIPIFGS